MAEWTLRDEIEAQERTLALYCNRAQAGEMPADAREFRRRVALAFGSIKDHMDREEQPA